MESHTHGKDAGTDTAVVRDLIAKDGTGYRIHDKPDVSFDSTDFDIGFVGNKSGSGFVIIVVNERLDDAVLNGKNIFACHMPMNF